MTAFLTPTDIGSRAAQYCGQPRLDPTLGFGDTSSKAASEIGFVYNKVRQAELEENAWTCAVKRTILRAVDSNTMLLAPALWSSVVTYFVGSIVSDQDGNLWISRIPNNLGYDPLLTTQWEPYFGPLAVPLYAADSFFSGELVYTASGDGTYRVYLSLQDGNTDVPSTSTDWSATATYFKNEVITRLSVAYMSLIDLNINQDPALAPALFNISTTYAAGDKVGGSDGVIYQSVGSGNIGHDPTLDVAHTFWTNTGVLNPWTTVFVSGTGSSKWLEIGGSEFPAGVGLTKLNILYPIGSLPSTQSASRNAFKLPSGFLRIAPQNPKGTVDWLGGPSGVTYNDWNFENGFLVSQEAGPISFRFVADLTDVRLMHAMFCEGLAARIALSVCEPLTQSTSKLQSIAGAYRRFIDQAKTQNAIEAGYDDPPDDPYITVRY